MVKRHYGTLGDHVLIGLLTVWWTLGLGNVVYAASKYFGDADQKVVRDPTPKTQARSSPEPTIVESPTA